MTYNEELTTIINGMKKIVKDTPKRKSYYEGEEDKTSHITPRDIFIEMFKNMGYIVETTVHACNIGNNNENRICKRVPMENGYVADCVMGYFHYTYDIYGKKCYFWFEDANKERVVSSKDLGICYSE